MKQVETEVIVKSSSREYQKIRALFELFGYVVVGDELTWQQVDRWLLDHVYRELRLAREEERECYLEEFWSNAYALCITAVRLGINEFDAWDE